VTEVTLWSVEDKADVAKWWAEGLSATEISRRLPGRSKNAVIGIVHRMGLMQNGDRPARRQPEKPAAPRLTKPRASHQSLRFGWGYQPSPEEAEAKRAAFHEKGTAILADFKAKAAPAGDAIPLIGRPFGRCAFPVGTPATPGEQLCCGAEVREGAPYCPSHCTVAYARAGAAPLRSTTENFAAYATWAERIDRYVAKRPKPAPIRTPWDEARVA
jgi:GcrA cell cycle regulator